MNKIHKKISDQKRFKDLIKKEKEWVRLTDKERAWKAKYLKQIHSLHPKS